MNPFPVQQASQLAKAAAQAQWLVEELWSAQAVGILGGEPKCCKSFLALDVAVSVASGAPCLRQFPVRRTGKVLLFPAEDSLAVVRQRMEGIAAAAQVSFESLPVQVITTPCLRLDTPTDRQRLADTVQQLQPILLVHHARKDSHTSRPGQALRGSSELHGWGDSNLYLRRRADQLLLCTEHRAAPSRGDIPLQLTQAGSALALAVLPHAPGPACGQEPPPLEKVRQTLAQLQEPVPVQKLRKLCGMRMATVLDCLDELQQRGLLTHNAKGYQLKPRPDSQPVSVSAPLHRLGNGNGKPTVPNQLELSCLCSSGG
jgi:biotin operon repressor